MTNSALVGDITLNLEGVDLVCESEARFLEGEKGGGELILPFAEVPSLSIFNGSRALLRRGIAVCGKLALARTSAEACTWSISRVEVFLRRVSQEYRDMFRVM